MPCRHRGHFEVTTDIGTLSYSSQHQRGPLDVVDDILPIVIHHALETLLWTSTLPQTLLITRLRSEGKKYKQDKVFTWLVHEQSHKNVKKHRRNVPRQARQYIVKRYEAWTPFHIFSETFATYQLLHALYLQLCVIPEFQFRTSYFCHQKIPSTR